MAKDIFHDLVKASLEAEGWTITDDPYRLVFDEQRDRYLWLYVGWEGSQRIYFTIVHFDIQEGKIWLQQNATDSNSK